MLVSTLPGLVLPCQSGQQWTWGRHHSGCCRGSRSAQCCTWVFNVQHFPVRCQHFPPSSKELTTYLKSSPMPPYSTGLLTPSRPASPSFLNTWTVFAFYDLVWIKSSPLLLGTSPPPPIGWQMGWCPEQSWLRSKLSWVYFIRFYLINDPLGGLLHLPLF